MTEIKEEEGLSVARACKLVSLVRCMYYYESVRDDSAVETKLAWYGEKLPSRGFPEYFKRIRQEGLRDGTIRELEEFTASLGWYIEERLSVVSPTRPNRFCCSQSVLILPGVWTSWKIVWRMEESSEHSIS